MGAGGWFSVAAHPPVSSLLPFPPPALRFYGKARVIQAINQMLGPAGAICGVSPPPAAPRSHCCPHWLPVTSPCWDEGDSQRGGARLASICCGDALRWAIWRGLQRLISERL